MAVIGDAYVVVRAIGDSVKKDIQRDFNGLDKKQATEFSFLLAVPTMFAATGYDLLKSEIAFSNEELKLLIVGLVVAFITAWIAVKIFLKIVSNYGFKHFGYYRIIIGILFLIYMGNAELM